MIWPAILWWHARLELTASDLAKLATLDAPTRALAAQLLRSPPRLAITSARRSYEEQAALYAQGRTAPGPIVTYAPPGTSLHEHGRAFDVAPLNSAGKPHWPEDPALWEAIGKRGEALGLKWGGRWTWPDRPHFERR